jgi:hypothetical protein
MIKRAMVAFHDGRLTARSRFGVRYLEDALREIDRQRQPNRPPADDQHLAIDSIAHEKQCWVGDDSIRNSNCQLCR